DLRRGDVHPCRLDHVLDATEEGERPVRVQPTEVAGVEESLDVERVAPGSLVVVRQERRPPHADLALHAVTRGPSTLRVTDADLPPLHGRTMARRPVRERRVPGPRGAERRGLGHAERPDRMMLPWIETRGPLGVRAHALAKLQARRGKVRMRD